MACFSGWANRALRRPARLLEAMPPHGAFCTWSFDPAASRRYARPSLPGGSGITPVLSLLKTALRR